MLDPSSRLVAFVPSTDLDRAGDFYADLLGAPPIERNDYACVFDAGGTMLRVTQVAEVATPGYTVLGWQVDDIAATLRRLADAGVAPIRYEGMGQDEHGVWTTPGGDRVAWFNDPDANVVSLTELS